MTSQNFSQPLEKTLEFSTREAAQSAQKILESAQIDLQNLSIEVRESSTNALPLSREKTRESALGGAIAGGVFGIIVGAILSWIPTQFSTARPDVSGNPGLFVLGVCTLCGLAGALGFGLVGALTGADVPASSVEDPSESENSASYLMVVRGSEETLDRVLALLNPL